MIEDMINQEILGDEMIVEKDVDIGMEGVIAQEEISIVDHQREVSIKVDKDQDLQREEEELKNLTPVTNLKKMNIWVAVLDLTRLQKKKTNKKLSLQLQHRSVHKLDPWRKLKPFSKV